MFSSMDQAMGVHEACEPVPASGAFSNIWPLRPLDHWRVPILNGQVTGAARTVTGDSSLCEREVQGRILKHQVTLELSYWVFIVSKVTAGAPLTFGEKLYSIEAV